MARNSEMQFEIERDFATQFSAVQYRSQGYGKHFHRNLEIYGVVDGEVTVSIAGDKQVLTNGQIAVVNCMEAHAYDIVDTAEIFYFHIGTVYLSLFISQYKNKVLPHWLLDTEFNKELYTDIEKLFHRTENVSELKKHGIATYLLAKIVDRYGVIDGENDASSHEFIEKVIQYIYEHYTEELTLASLSREFSMDPKWLSKKLFGCLGTDLRVFINDIRSQKAIQLLNDPAMRDVPKKEIMQLCGFKRSATYYTALKRQNGP